MISIENIVQVLFTNNIIYLKFFITKINLWFDMRLKVLFVLSLLFLLGCKNEINTTELIYAMDAVYIDCSCTEAWINVKTSNVPLPYTLTAKINDSVKTFENILSTDTVIRVQYLQPNHNYQAKLTIQLEKKELSRELSFKTMDTTSNNFTWKSYEFGVGHNNTFFDVAVIDEDDIWVVGAFYLNDSLGHIDEHVINAVHWDGYKWDTVRIPTKTFTGEIYAAPIRAIYAFNKDDIWTISEAGSYSHWNGLNWETEYIPNDGTGYCIWGSSSNNIYIGGYKGSLLHYDGTRWKKINSGIPYDINDVYGAWDEKKQKYEVIGVASDIYHSNQRVIFKIVTETVERISDYPLYESLSSVWFIPARKYFVGGSGIFVKSLLSDSLWLNKARDFTPFYTNHIRGTDVNNVFATGHFGDMLHFNGKSWNSLRTATALTSGYFCKISLRDNIICSVGESNYKAVIYIGKHF